MNERLAEELTLLRQIYPAVDFQELDRSHWFQIHGYRVPSGWLPAEVSTVFSVTDGYPGVEPYGFFIPAGLNLNGSLPEDRNPPHPPPFPGDWRCLSWQPEQWYPTADLLSGSNLWGWVRSFKKRLEEGV